MKNLPRHQVLPPSGPEREALREKGQFWTPRWVADAMVQYAVHGTRKLFDPAVGEGAFFEAALDRFGESISLAGADIDPAMITGTRSKYNRAHLAERDFVLDPPEELIDAIVANPPYLRHHRLPSSLKQKLQALSLQIIGAKLDGRTGYHVYFLLRALERLKPDGRLSFILPADTFEGLFAQTIWQWILGRFTLDAALTFSGNATPFPGVDTNAVVVFIRNSPPPNEHKIQWARCNTHGSSAPSQWVASNFRMMPNNDLRIENRSVGEVLKVGLSRPPGEIRDGIPLGSFAYTMRGIATGANDFFCMTREQLESKHLPLKRFTRIVIRTRDAKNSHFTLADLEELDTNDTPTYLLNLTGDNTELQDKALRDYIESGVALGLPKRSLINQRRPWYKMEKRTPPDFLFAYLGRRNQRFIRNDARVVPSTGFLCVYAKKKDQAAQLHGALNDERTLHNLKFVGKSYGSDAIKVEPRSLERLLIPHEVCAEFRLSHAHPTQLFEDESVA